MLACVDVDYRSDRVVAACLGFEAWSDASARVEEVLVSMEPPAAYEPGAFFRRELPYVTGVLARLGEAPELVIVDGFVWLAEGVPGLGAHLFAALGGRVSVVGVAKRPFRGGSVGVPVVRGSSRTPLFVTAAGMNVDEAARRVASMHGPHRIPTLLKRVDRVSRIQG
jgi:deoxyribonuclease V